MQVSGYSGANIVGVMITNNSLGHSPATHARATAAKIVIDPWPQDDPTGDKTRAAAKLRDDLFAYLCEHHSRIANGNLPETDMALRYFLGLTKGTVLEQHYANPLVQDLIRFELAHEFGSQFQFIAANQKQ